MKRSTLHFKRTGTHILALIPRVLTPRAVGKGTVATSSQTDRDFNVLPQLAWRQQYGQQRTLTGRKHDLLRSEASEVYIPIAESRTRLNGCR
jgi:hypothetical protein